MASRRPQAGASHRLFVTVCPLDLWWMLPSVWGLVLKHEERVQKAFSVDHHGPGDARLSHGAKGIYGELGDTVLSARSRSSAALEVPAHHESARSWTWLDRGRGSAVRSTEGTRGSLLLK